MAAEVAAAAPTVSTGKRGRQDEGEEEEEARQERSVSKWRRIDEEYRKLVPFRDAAVDRWHRKTMLISGKQPLL